jgi:long-chain acyl-CoA synthetase
MHPSIHARTAPERPAFIMASSGETVTYAELERRSNQGAQLFRSLGLKRGDGIAILLENSPRYFEVVWAAERAGLYFTCISTKLTPGEVEYIVKDSGAKVLIAGAALNDIAQAVAPLLPGVALYMTGGAVAPYRSFEDARAAMPEAPIADQSHGYRMLYSSGTTGRPKGVRNDLPEWAFGSSLDFVATLGQAKFGIAQDTVYLSPAPLYHAAPLGWSQAVHQLGGTVVIMERFDAEACLAFIEQYRCTHAQMVPTHFVRILKLDPAIRSKYDLSTLRNLFHAAAPCPVPVKEQMIQWLGPIVHEYYGGTEGNGLTVIGPQEWLTHKGSVGRAAVAELHICSETGEPLPPRQEGLVYFGGGRQFKYHNDPGKTADAYNRLGWSTLGDIGWLDEEGYLYLTDRKSFMIISGGVNIYPQEIENLLVTHPKVMDVAVVGAPDEEMGEKVVAVVQPMDWSEAGDALAAELDAFARAHLSHVKIPRRIDFMQELPRHATGKLYKRLIRDAYWAQKGSRIV